jgi:uncharacterized membrane protein
MTGDRRCQNRACLDSSKLISEWDEQELKDKVRAFLFDVVALVGVIIVFLVIPVPSALSFRVLRCALMFVVAGLSVFLFGYGVIILIGWKFRMPFMQVLWMLVKGRDNAGGESDQRTTKSTSGRQRKEHEKED